ncbi:DEHA2D05258p [Debaryomyces hansenii CBS767]|uniref:DEHA2D05258p n=1 Tax=Debaryomyces hansenii (strain ATCC 36239 / CBS 767 / BCRC 21394 / JCM 1990 / NBRC 0083 / IGC 2968) TaxID=284592 RepID=Q6BSX5_DEBHA|nr:DEHA2D05258p [Debaryomyces hansenii CBS767]CAG86834.2 DEHA2D05258p [Debaryomyces hansenii CBS767]|eukprot:XP_458695.2 DEHA2D05258p [Debaryomyces hansenii CBS767]
MHIFESLEKAIPIEEWNMDNVYEVIKVMLEDHSLRISEVFDEISINHWTRATKQDVTSRKLHR